jgi:capsid protein
MRSAPDSGPKWTTSNPDFNKEVTDAFHYANRDPRIFSSDGASDVYSAQYNIRRMIRLDGDCFGQFIRSGDRPTAGFGTQNPCVHLIPGYLVDNYGDEADDSGWERGVRRDPLGRPLQYRVLKIPCLGLLELGISLDACSRRPSELELGIWSFS